MKKNISKLMVLSSFLAGFLIVAPVAAEAVATPAQFLAKMYTEALGRAPDQGGWQGWVTWFNGQPSCAAAMLKSAGEAFYLSPEYANLGYDPAAKLLTAYRGILNREPDQAGYTSWLSYLNSGGSWQTVLDGFFNSSEFNALVGQICSVDPYFFGSMPVMSPGVVPTTGNGFTGGTADQLQTELNNHCPSGSTYYLAQKAVVTLDKALIIHGGCTLTTTGNLSHSNKYALMGRLVRVSNFTDYAVALEPGAVLDGVWVDGQRSFVDYYSGYNKEAPNIIALGTNTTVRNSRSSNSAGWTALRAQRHNVSLACNGLLIENNLITGYSSNHFGEQSDGISVSCENAEVRGNQIVDVTDGGIVLFKAEQGVVQQSIIHDNTIVAAGSSLYWGLVATEDFSCNGLDNPIFSGRGFYNNTVWSGPNNHVDLALGVGTRVMLPPTAPGPGGCTLQHNTGTGATFSGNTTGSLSVRTSEGINVAGMNYPTVQNNSLTVNLVQTVQPGCPMPNYPPGAYVAFDTQFIGGTIQDPKQGFADNLMLNCLLNGPHIVP